MSKKIEESNLSFNESHMVTGKTKLWNIVNKRGEYLGRIKWYGAFRGYCFYTDSQETIYDHKCLLEVWTFITNANREHRMKNSKEGKAIAKIMSSK